MQPPQPSRPKSWLNKVLFLISIGLVAKRGDQKERRYAVTLEALTPLERDERILPRCPTLLLRHGKPSRRGARAHGPQALIDNRIPCHDIDSSRHGEQACGHEPLQLRRADYRRRNVYVVE